MRSTVLALALVVACTTPPSSPSSPDTTPPSAPANLTVQGSTRTAITLSWSASTDDVAVTGYSVFAGGLHRADVAETLFAFDGLACGAQVLLAVEAHDAEGNS